MIVSNKVREARIAAGLSGEKLARRADMSGGDLSKLERGLLYPYAGWRRRLSIALDVPEEELFPAEAEAGAK